MARMSAMIAETDEFGGVGETGGALGALTALELECLEQDFCASASLG